MAESHITFDRNKQHGRQLERSLDLLVEGLDSLNEIFAVFNQMKDGDGSQASHFTYATSMFGFSSDEKTKAAYDELNSLQFKLNTNASVTDVNAALLQARHKLG